MSAYPAFAGKTVLMMAGGTGGHVYPALAVAQAARESGASVHWLGNAQGFEGRKVPEYGFAFHDIAVRGLRGKGVLGWLRAPLLGGRAHPHCSLRPLAGRRRGFVRTAPRGPVRRAFRGLVSSARPL